MGKERLTVGEGLRQVLWGELLTVVSLVASDVGRGLQILPLVWLGGLVVVISMGMIIVGLAGAASVRQSYRSALLCVVGELALSIAIGFVADGGKAILSILSALTATVGVWFVCEGTEEFLCEEGEKGSGGSLVWKLYAVGTVLTAVTYAVFLYSPWFPMARLPVMVIAPLIQMAVLLLYLHFLNQCQHTLRGK